MLTTLKKSAKKVFLITLVVVSMTIAAIPAQARLEYYLIGADGSFCADHYDLNGNYDFRVCWSAGTNRYTFLP